MAIEQRIETCIGTDEAKMVRVRLSLLLVDGSSGRVVSRHYHSAPVAPGDDLAVLRAKLEADLAAGWISGMAWPKIPNEQWADVEAHVAIVQKPVVVEAYRQGVAARVALAEAQAKAAGAEAVG
jgi:hypothetical protein